MKFRYKNLRSQIPGMAAWLVFAAITGITIIHHAMWRDEWEAILISYKSNSFNDLWKQTSEEGHPILWFLLMYITKFLGSPIVIPKLLNYLSALGYCGIILFYAPFPRLARYALVFGYFFLFEYAVIARDYAISTLFIVAVMALWENRQKHRWLFAILLFLLAQASFYATMIAGVFVIILLTESLLLKGKWQLNPKDLLPAAFGIGGIIVSYITCARTPSMLDNRLFFNSNHLLLALDRIYCGYLPIPDFTQNSWNSTLPANNYVQAVFSLVIITVVIYFLRADKRALVFWIIYVIMHEIFTYFFIIGYVRHSGFIFIASVIAFWFIYLSNPSPVFKSFQKIIISGALALHVFIALYFVGINIYEPFSESAETAAWLHKNHLDRLPIYGDYIYSTQGISGYLDKPITDIINQKTYFAVRWSEMQYFNPDSMLNVRFQQILSAHDSSVLLTDYPIPFISKSLQQGNTHIIPLKQFTNSNIDDENFYIYLLKR